MHSLPNSRLTTLRREQNFKGGPRIYFALHMNFPVVALYDFMCQGKPESKALFFRRIFGIEYVIDFTGCQATPRIGYPDAYHPGPVPPGRNIDTPLSGDRLHGVFQEVVEGLAQFVHIHRYDERIIPFPFGPDGDTLEIKVNCRKDASKIENPIPYGLVVSLEVAEGVDIQIYNEIRSRIAPVVRVRQSL